MLALLVLLLAVPAFFAWGWFAPPMSGVGILLLVAITALALAYPAKIVLEYVGEAGTLWTRVAGCLTSTIIAFGDLAIVWGVANGLRHQVFTPASQQVNGLVLWVASVRALVWLPQRRGRWKILGRPDLIEALPLQGTKSGETLECLAVPMRKLSS